MSTPCLPEVLLASVLDTADSAVLPSGMFVDVKYSGVKTKMVILD